ncbi:hypothetical protein [Roseofilum casamattae]|uniref:Uncharacterized protein n=1 Tax=Roseofilum casamattae BLCC-M143 TaxID=3022442 RepID=A0ABT7C3F2_9CYAN|nr:hypothetical protein [Roseofilum casamattae]MDJ1185855.1 hypothetical protein [Roseofilum casamattae BLCC-M143]
MTFGSVVLWAIANTLELFQAIEENAMFLRTRTNRSQGFANRLNLGEPKFVLANLPVNGSGVPEFNPPIPAEQQANIEQFRTGVRESIDNPPSETAIAQLQTTVESAIADGSVTLEEKQAIAAARQDLVESMGVTEAEKSLIIEDVQTIVSFAIENRVSPEQQENIAQLRSNLQTSIDNPPSEDSIEQLQTTVGNAIADDSLTAEEQQAIAQATQDVFQSMGLTPVEMLVIASDLQTIVQSIQLPTEDGQSAIDVLANGGSLDPSILENTVTDAFAMRAGGNHFAPITTLFGNTESNSFGSPTANFPMPGNGATLGSQVPEFIAAIAEGGLANLSQGFTFIG